MKQNKINIFAMLTLGGVMVCAPIARADDAAPATPATPAAPTTPPPAAGGHRGAGMQELIKSLDLTPEQLPKYKEIMKDSREKMMTLRNDTSVTGDDRKSKMKEINEATVEKMKTLLTPDQFTKWTDARKNMRQGGGHQPPAAATVPDAPTKAN